MAASLGCKVEVVRMVEVGECEWQEPSDEPQPKMTLHKAARSIEQIPRHQARLYVAEALVTPDLSSRRNIVSEDVEISNRYETPPPRSNMIGVRWAENDPKPEESTEELRVTFTGPTTSGKSSLLGTLSTATLDNGRGKSRLSLLKHRHEIASGVTSSVTQE
jgi:hypothetical protein